MALTALKLGALKGRKFDTLYGAHEQLWLQKAKDAHEYTKLLLKPTGEEVRPDDVLVTLEPAVELSPEFRKHAERLSQQYWKTWFSEYILDKVWSEL